MPEPLASDFHHHRAADHLVHLAGGGSPGDEIVIHGTFPQTLTHARFVATTGGFVGIQTMIMPIISSTATQAKVLVPSITGFAPPNATPPGNPLGTVDVRDAGGQFSATHPFYFYAGSHLDPNGLTKIFTSHGLGSTNSLGCRAAASFSMAGGPPNLPGGNPNFALTLENATPSSPLLLAIGVADPSPSVAIGDGLIGIDITQPYLVLAPPQIPAFTDLSGTANFALPLPAGPLGVSGTIQWAYVDSGSGQLVISTGLILNI